MVCVCTHGGQILREGEDGEDALAILQKQSCKEQKEARQLTSHQ